MGLSKRKLGELIKLSTDSNVAATYMLSDVRGISIQKKFIETKANMDGVPLSSYLLVKPLSFAYVTVTSRNGSKISLAFNDTCDTYIVSSTYVVFDVGRTDLLDADFLFMYFNRPEFDRYARFNSWGSARETFNWEDMCDLEIDLPPLSIQQKYVAIYKAMVANQQSYERGLEDLGLICDGYIENMRSHTVYAKLGKYIELVETTNQNLTYGMDDVRGVSIDKKFIATKADMTGVSLSPYYVIQPNDFAYVTVTSRNGEKISIALNDSDDTYICSSSYIVFRCRDSQMLFPQYLMLFFARSEFNRYARYNSWGSAREIFDWDAMCDVQIPIPSIEIQKAIAEIYAVYIRRKRINEQMKARIRDICPILIKGSLEEGEN